MRPRDARRVEIFPGPATLVDRGKVTERIRLERCATNSMHSWVYELRFNVARVNITVFAEFTLQQVRGSIVTPVYPCLMHLGKFLFDGLYGASICTNACPIAVRYNGEYVAGFLILVRRTVVYP